MTTDIKELRRLAEAATPGVWYRGADLSAVCAPIERGKNGWAAMICKFPHGAWTAAEEHVANADFIAAANPETVLALIARIEQLSTQTAEPEPNINAVWDAIAEYCWTYHEAMVPVIRPGAEQAYRAAGRALKALIGDRTDHDEAQSGIKTPSMKAK